MNQNAPYVSIYCFSLLVQQQLEDALFECFQDALLSQITQGAADVVIDDDKRKNARHNLSSSPHSIWRVIETRLDLG